MVDQGVSNEGAADAPTRRSFLNWMIGLGALTWLGSLVYPVLRYLKPLSAEVSSAPVKLTHDEVLKVEQNHFVIVRSGDARVIVFESGGALRALDAKCTHEGCTVQFVAGETLLWCACHNGRFDVEGRVLSGPPPRPLGKWVAAREDDGSITVSRAKA